MITLRPGKDRFHSDFGWLDSHHTFAFGDHYHPDHLGFRALRVINDDRVEAGAGFGKHGHRDMEIISYVLEGALRHNDSMGTGSVIRPGEVQRMTAGTGVMHSEHNDSQSEPVHFLQIWIVPDRRGIEPSYEQKAFPEAERRGRLRVVASPDGRDGSVTIHQDATMLATLLSPGESVSHELRRGRHAWIHVARGAVSVNGAPLVTGDGAAVSDEAEVRVQASADSEVLLFDLA